MPTNKLTDSKLRSLKPDPAKTFKTADGGGLSIVVTPQGSKLWELAYRFEGKQKNLRFGAYPLVSLAEARAKRDEAKKLLLEGVDPSAKRKELKEAGFAEPRSLWKDVAETWLAKREREGAKPATLNKNAWLLGHTFEALGDRPVASLTTQDFLAVLQEIETAGKFESAQRARAVCEQVCRFAKASGLLKENPISDLRGALVRHKAKHRPGLTNPKEVGELFRSFRCYQGDAATIPALRFLAYTFLRPGELRALRWEHVEWERCRLFIPADAMKMKEPHIVPLSRQALAILDYIEPLTGRRPYIFASAIHKDRSISENTMNSALVRLGFSKDRVVPHGFRTTASTLLNEQGFHPDWIERQLAHRERNKVRAAYNAAQYLDGRTAMMQHWADYLDGLEADVGVSIQPSRKGFAERALSA
jgi:integrase